MIHKDAALPAGEDRRTENADSAYQPPALEVIGTIEELTLGGTGSNFDGAEIASTIAN